jgi:hypothetical protein
VRTSVENSTLDESGSIQEELADQREIEHDEAQFLLLAGRRCKQGT